MRIALKFAYNGTRFHGYARQPHVKTVEEELLNKLIEYHLISDIKTASVRTASRTDKGVSALGNVMAFTTESWDEAIFHTLSSGINDIFIYGYKIVDSSFYPRFARQRIYRYYLKKNSIDIERIMKAASLFVGKHDFSNFARVESFRNPVRNIDNIMFCEQDAFLVIDFFAQTFLWHQIRRIMSALRKVSCGVLNEDHIINALNHPTEKVDFGVAEPEPLILRDVLYDFEFFYKKNAATEKEKFEDRIVSSLK